MCRRLLLFFVVLLCVNPDTTDADYCALNSNKGVLIELYSLLLLDEYFLIIISRLD